MRFALCVIMQSDGDNREEEYRDTKKSNACEPDRVYRMKPKFHVCIISTAPSRVKSRFGGGPYAVAVREENVACLC